MSTLDKLFSAKEWNQHLSGKCVQNAVMGSIGSGFLITLHQFRQSKRIFLALNFGFMTAAIVSGVSLSICQYKAAKYGRDRANMLQLEED